jgi:hypothetical protein
MFLPRFTPILAPVYKCHFVPISSYEGRQNSASLFYVLVPKYAPGLPVSSSTPGVTLSSSLHAGSTVARPDVGVLLALNDPHPPPQAAPVAEP